MKTAKLFRNGNSQAVRLPKEFAFEGDEVRVEKVGNVVILSPKERSWEGFWAACGKFTKDFTIDRDYPPLEEREPL